MKTKLLTILALLVMCVTGAWADEVTVTAFKASGSSPYTYECISDNYAINEVEIVTSDVVSNPVGNSQLKVPANGTLTVSAHGKNVTKVVIVWKNNPSITVGGEAVSTSSKTTTWEGSATSVVFTNGSSANQFGTITVTYSGSFGDDYPSSVTLSSLTRGLYNSSSIYTIGYTSEKNVYGLYLKGKVGSDINIDTSSNTGTISVKSPKAMSSIVLNWTDSKGNAKTPSMTPSVGTYNAETKTWSAPSGNTTIKEVTFTNGETSKYYLKDQNVVITFASSNPILSVSPSTASAFAYVVGNGPSDAQTFTVTGSNLTDDDITVSLQAGESYYEISKDNTTFGTTSLTVASGDEVYVRLKKGLSNNSYAGTLRFANDGASDVDIALSGSVTNQVYTVTYDLNGGDGEAPTEDPQEAGAPITLPAAPTKDCSTFDGWKCDVDNVVYAAGADYTMTAAPTTFTAQWTESYASGKYDFQSSATVGSKTVTTSEDSYTAFQIDNLFFSAMTIAYDNGSTSSTGDGDNFNGWKIKTNGATIKFLVETDKLVTVGVGKLTSGMNISYTALNGSATNAALTAATNNTYLVKGGTLVTLTTGGNKTVTLKKIFIQDYEAVSVSAAKYATFVSDYDLDFSSVDGLSAYTATVDGTTVTFTKVAGSVKAGEGLLLYADVDATTNFNVPVATDGPSAVAGNKLVRGTGAAVASDNGDGSHNYILSNNGGVVNFYLAAGKTVGTDKAFLSQISASTAKISLPGDDDETTAINELSTKHVENGKFYNLQGMEVKNPTKGIYIVNGKKVIIK